MVTATTTGPPQILDQYGRPFTRRQARTEVARLRGELRKMQAGYDAAQTTEANRNHWSNADNYSPNSANSYTIRRALRSRSRYEVIENNPYLKGIVLSVANDFVGKGPKLQITDKRIPRAKRLTISRAFQKWAKKIRLRSKLWRLRTAKIVDGEGFARVYLHRTLKNPVKLNLSLFESDRCTTEAFWNQETDKSDVDGIQLDQYGDPAKYFVLNKHPGTTNVADPAQWTAKLSGKWLPAKTILQWFRQDRGWDRGIPETTPSLPLCSILRRYTIATLLAAETAADFAAVLTTDGPPNAAAWTDGQGTQIEDDPFDTFPIDKGMFTTIPWGYRLQQLEAKHPGAMYDTFVDAILREIARPFLCPFNMASGTSKDSNMASGVLDAHIYTAGIAMERTDCEEVVLGPLFDLWWELALTTPSYLEEPGVNDPASSPLLSSFRNDAPNHSWRWDQVTPDHTDPLKVANALTTLHRNGHVTDRDIQEGRFNRSVDDWQEDLEEQEDFRRKLGPLAITQTGAESEEKPEKEED